MLFRKCVNGVRVLALAAVVTGFVPLWQSGTAQAQVAIGISVNFAPPALPVYEQPLCPGDGYIWTPGYWAWDPDYGDYYWVPGTWVLAPQLGYLWTPPYWGWNGVAFIFHEGYWGPRVGFYGGINYGWGYPGRGYYGGRWERDRFYYNRSVNNVNVTQIHNIYNKTVINNVNVTRVSYNGGDGGVRERASRQEEEAFRQRHVAPVAAQQQHIQEARADRALRASDNRGKPPIAATDRPGQFHGGNVVAAREGKYNPPANSGGGNRPDNRVENNRPGNARPENNVNRAPEPNRPATRNDRNDRPPNARGPENSNNRPTYVHPNDMPKTNRSDRPPSSGNAKADQKYNQRSDNMYKKQEQERQNLEKKQEQQHARAEQQRQNDDRRQQMEKQHQQETQKLEQRQRQQEQKMQRQAPKPKEQAQPKQQPPKQQGEKPHGRGR